MTGSDWSERLKYSNNKAKIWVFFQIRLPGACKRSVGDRLKRILLDASACTPLLVLNNTGFTIANFKETKRKIGVKNRTKHVFVRFSKNISKWFHLYVLNNMYEWPWPIHICYKSFHCLYHISALPSISNTHYSLAKGLDRLQILVALNTVISFRESTIWRKIDWIPERK